MAVPAVDRMEMPVPHHAGGDADADGKARLDIRATSHLACAHATADADVDGGACSAVGMASSERWSLRSASAAVGRPVEDRVRRTERGTDPSVTHPPAVADDDPHASGPKAAVLPVRVQQVADRTSVVARATEGVGRQERWPVDVAMHRTRHSVCHHRQ
jgi:hypothetical protein